MTYALINFEVARRKGKGGDVWYDINVSQNRSLLSIPLRFTDNLNYQNICLTSMSESPCSLMVTYFSSVFDTNTNVE